MKIKFITQELLYLRKTEIQLGFLLSTQSKLQCLLTSENTNGLPIPKGKDFVINLIDEELIKRDISKAREHEC